MKGPVKPRILAIAGYRPGEQPGPGSKLIKLNTNENPYPASPSVLSAVTKAAERLHLYPEPLSDGLRQVAANSFSVEPENIIVGNGSDEILSLCFKACTEPGDTVAFSVPTYSLYRTLAELTGCVGVEAAATDGNVPKAVLDANASITFLCTPNSPLGYEIPLGQVRAVASATPGLVVVDEAYVDFGGRTALQILQECSNVLILRTLSKSYSLAGARIGLGIARRELISELVKVKDSYNVSRLAQVAGAAALDDPEWMAANVSRICGTRERVRTALEGAGFKVPPSVANFLWVDCGGLGGEATNGLLREHGVLARYFDDPMLRSGIRVTIGTDAEMDVFLEIMLTRVRSALASS